MGSVPGLQVVMLHAHIGSGPQFQELHDNLERLAGEFADLLPTFDLRDPDRIRELRSATMATEPDLGDCDGVDITTGAIGGGPASRSRCARPARGACGRR